MHIRLNVQKEEDFRSYKEGTDIQWGVLGRFHLIAVILSEYDEYNKRNSKTFTKRGLVPFGPNISWILQVEVFPFWSVAMDHRDYPPKGGCQHQDFLLFHTF